MPIIPTVVLALLLNAHSGLSQRLPIRNYSVSDGLAQNSVRSIHQDRKGYIWIGTNEGLSRFDGYRFTNYGIHDGLPHPIINDIVEDLQGRLWVGTNGGGVARFIDEPVEGQTAQAESPAVAQKPKFISFLISDTPASNAINKMLLTKDNILWCLTDGGLYRASVTQGGDAKFEVVVSHRSYRSSAAFADQEGRLWFALEDNLIEIVQDQIITYDATDNIS